jgi:hypothetical protein
MHFSHKQNWEGGDSWLRAQVNHNSKIVFSHLEASGKYEALRNP